MRRLFCRIFSSVRRIIVSEKKVINLPGTTPIAPYSPAVIAGGFVFVAGQVGFDPVALRYYGDDIAAQVRGM
ncbi:MAG: hypothetical protein LBG91_04600, partial [Treponema sp.]|nr:hypothetical protein [Treponema sp.]